MGEGVASPQPVAAKGSPASMPREPEVMPPEIPDGLEGAGSSGTTGASGDVERSEVGRLCVHPYRIGSTPGKGGSTGTRRDLSAPFGSGAPRGADPEVRYAAERRRLKKGMQVAVGELAFEDWNTKVGAMFDDLDPAVRHTIRVRGAGSTRTRKTLKLRFDPEGPLDICLRYDPFYGTYQLRKLRPGTRCGPCTTRENPLRAPGP